MRGAGFLRANRRKNPSERGDVGGTFTGTVFLSLPEEHLSGALWLVYHGILHCRDGPNDMTFSSFSGAVRGTRIARR